MPLLTAAICLPALAQDANRPKTPPKEDRKQEDRPPSAPSADGAPGGLGAPVDLRTYVIGAEDVLFVRVWRENDFSGPVMVRPDGRFSMPLIGDLQAAGITPVQLARHIAEALTKYLNSPEVSVSVQQINSKKYYVNGEINRPGPYPLVVPTRVMEALSNAGGFKEFANRKKIVILRGSKRFYFNYKEVSEGKKMEQNILLEPGDQVFVK